MKALHSILFLLLFSLQSFAAQDSESPYLLANSEGISKPGVPTAMLENPAGLVLNKRPKFVGLLASSESDFDPKTVGVGFITGSDSAGIGLLYTKADAATKGQLALGVGAGMRDVDVSVGATAYADTKLDHKDIDVGILLNGRRGDISFGFTGYQLSSGVNKLGAGMTYRLDREATFSVDVTSNKSMKGKVIKPALLVTSNPLQLSIGYGFETDKKAPPVSAKGLGLGIAIEAGRTVALFGHYNHLAKYFAGLALKF